MQELLEKLKGISAKDKLFKELYPTLLREIGNQEFYIALDKDRVEEKSSIPLLGIQEDNKKVFVFTTEEAATSWCQKTDNIKHNKNLIAKISRKQLFDTLIVALIYKTFILTINQFQDNQVSVFIKDVIVTNQYNFDYEVKIPRLKIELDK